MKKLILVSLVFCFAVMAFAVDPSANNARTTFRNGYQWSGNASRDFATQWAQQVEAAAEIGQDLGTGSVFYVDSNVSTEGDGTSWTKAKDTLDEGVNLCTADRGDWILVAQGHNEDLAGADGVDADVAGVTIKGIGNGTLTPTLDFDASGSEFVIGAANVTVINIRFRPGTNAVTAGIDIEAAGDGSKILGCDFGFAEASTDEFAAAIKIQAGADNGLIEGCYFNAGAQAAVQAILIASECIGQTINGNHAQGDYSTAVIVGGAATQDDIVMTNNTFFNGNMTGDNGLNSEPCIEMTDGSSGFIAGNWLIADVATGLLIRVADDFVFMNNFVNDTDGDEFTGSKSDDSATIAGFTDG